MIGPNIELINRIKLVYHDRAMDIYEVPDPRPYFEVLTGSAEMHVSSRTKVDLRCTEKTRLLRRELYFPGWSVTASGAKFPIRCYKDLFQEITLPAGTWRVHFSYLPPYMELGFAAFLVGLLILAATWFLPWRSWRERSGSRLDKVVGDLEKPVAQAVVS
jgi:hypothetical protein